MSQRHITLYLGRLQTDLEQRLEKAPTGWNRSALVRHLITCYREIARSQAPTLPPAANRVLRVLYADPQSLPAQVLHIPENVVAHPDFESACRQFEVDPAAFAATLRDLRPDQLLVLLDHALFGGPR